MPLDIREFLALADQEQSTRNGEGNKRGSSYGGDGDSLIDRIMSQHTEGGGPFGGRDNALVKMVGYLRSKRFDYNIARWLTLQWNREYCFPALSDHDVLEKVSRGWARWSEGAEPDATPEDFHVKKAAKSARVIMTADELLDLDASGKGMEWLVPNVFARGGTHFLSAPAAGAKSWLMLDLSRCIAMGIPWLGTYDVPMGSVLYVDEEMGEGKTSKRVKQLGFGRGAPFYYLGKQGIQINDRSDLGFIVQTCLDKEISLICLDTLTGVRPGLRENESEHVSQLRTYFNTITATGATLIVAHHDRKNGQGESDVAHYRMAGSRDFGAMADMAYGIEKRGSFFHLSVTKNRLLSEDDAIELDFVLEDNVDKSAVVIRVIDASERSDKYVGEIAERILQALVTNGPMNVRSVTDAVKGKAEAIKKALDSLYQADRVVIEQRGQQKVYSLAE